jgi:hypothetical protein
MVKIEIWGEVAKKNVSNSIELLLLAIESCFKVELKFAANFHEQVNHGAESDDARLMVTNVVEASAMNQSNIWTIIDWYFERWKALAIARYNLLAMHQSINHRTRRIKKNKSNAN